MTTSVFDGCDDSCGWIAAGIAALAYGSFGVPIKATAKLDVHPLVFQSYKTVVMFVLSWGVLLLGVSAEWTPWGLLSGCLWVIGGTGGIYGIRMAGLAIAVGTWASIMICVNFVWGILIFQEPVADIWGTIGAFLLLISGLVGMSHFSAPQQQPPLVDITADENDIHAPLAAQTPFGGSSDNGDTDPLLEPNPDHATHIAMMDGERKDEPETTVLCGFLVTKRVAGIAGAVFNGLMTGSSLIPLHYAQKDGFGGARYMISFASGALISNCLLWVLWVSFAILQAVKRDLPGSNTLYQAMENMPLWHVQQLWLPAGIAGVLLSIAMFGSILSVTYLGQGVGNSLVQSKILVSGLWGIFYYQEIRGSRTIASWFMAASLTITGILWLSQQRIAAKSGGGGHRNLFEL